MNEFERKICSSENLRKMLNYNKSYDNYDEWILVGNCLKRCSNLINENELKQLWDEWSSQSTKFDQEISNSKWKSFSGEGSGIGHLYKVFKEEGGKNLVNGEFIREEFILDEKNYLKTLKNYQEKTNQSFGNLDKQLGLIFWNDDDNFRVFCSKEDGKYNPDGWSMTKEEILSTDLPLEFIKINNFKTNNFKELSKEHLKSFRFMLFEMDENEFGNSIPIEEQIKQVWSVEGMKDVIRKITFSGGKSIHILCESGVENLEEYQKLSKEVYELLKSLFKLNLDKSCKNPDRSSRISGFMRKDVYQSLIYINTDSNLSNLKEWKEKIVKKYKEHNEEQLKIIEGKKGFLTREREVKELLNHFFNGKIVKFKGREFVWNEEYYEELTNEIVEEIFYQKIKKPLENYNKEINFTDLSIRGGIKSFLKELEVREVDEIDNQFKYTLENGVFDVLTGELSQFNKDEVLTSKLNFKLDLQSSLEELEQTIKDKVYYWWKKQISWENFKKLMYLHLTRVNYRKLKFILMISGSTNTGKSSFNNFLNEFTSGRTLIKSGVKNSNFMLSGINEQTKILQFEDSELKGGFHLIKQLIGNKVVGVEGKGKDEVMVENHLFVKILSNLNKKSYPEFFHSESQYFTDKLWDVMFKGKIDEQDKEEFLKIGGEEYLVKKYGNEVVSYFLRTSKEFIQSPRSYLQDEFGVNLTGIYNKLIGVFLDQFYYKGEVEKPSRNSENLNKIYQRFKEYLSKLGISFSEFGKEQFLENLEMSGKRLIYHYKYKGGKSKNYLSSTFVFEVKGNFMFNLEERTNMDELIGELGKEDCPIDIRTGEWKELNEE